MLYHKVEGHRGKFHQLVYTLEGKYTDFHTCPVVKVMIVLTYLFIEKKSFNFMLYNYSIFLNLRSMKHKKEGWWRQIRCCRNIFLANRVTIHILAPARNVGNVTSLST